MTLSTQMKQYLTEYLAWALGAPNKFNPFVALCGNIPQWVLLKEHETGKYIGVGILDLQFELRKMFRVQGLDESFPFGDEASYKMERDKKIHHKNELRLSWIRKQLVE